jgi:DNA-binding helix-hairpin-helix protein with protein kinase domain
MIQLWLQRSQTRFDVSQAFAKRQLGESQGQELVATRKTARTTIAFVPGNAVVELASRQKLHQLGKHELTFEHKTSSAEKATISRLCQGKSVFASSSRVQAFVAATDCYSSGYLNAARR